MTNPPPNFDAVVFLPPVKSVSVVKDINATSGTNGTASISQVINTFSTPEPLAFVLVGCGLLGLAVWKLKKRVRSAQVEHLADR